MALKTIYLVTKLEIKCEEDSDMDEIVQEMDYNFKSTLPDTNVVDTEIVHFSWEEPQ